MFYPKQGEDMHKVFLYGFLFTLLLTGLNFSQEKKEVIIRCDDIGMCHSVNMAAKELIEAEIPFSASVMFVCPWYQEAVDLLKKHPEVSVGVHLTLNAEWKNFRWGPVLGKQAVPSLVDSCGYFTPSRSLFYKNNPRLEEIELELRAQIERAIQSGLKIDYVDYHMGTAVDKIEYREIVEKLAGEFNLGISRYFGEEDMMNVYDVKTEDKADSLKKIICNLKGTDTGLLVCHIGKEFPELCAMTDLNTFGLTDMCKHRSAELEALKSVSKTKFDNIRFLTYRQKITETGLENMKRPSSAGY